MAKSTTNRWPPPPDLASLKELFATADVEGLIAEEAPIDEYDPEARHFFEAINGYGPSELICKQTLPILEQIWEKQFMLDATQMTKRRPALLGLAEQIERFFGPEARPQVRS